MENKRETKTENKTSKNNSELKNPKTVLEIKNVSKLYGLNKGDAIKLLKKGASKEEVLKKTGVSVALWDASFDVKEGEIFVLIGLSGSGKSTMVRCLNRLNKPSSGEILFKGKKIQSFNKKELQNYRRNNIAMVFQSFGLMSHRDVLSNVVYGLEVKGVSKEEREAKAEKIIEMVGLSGFEHYPISSLSGGMSQRVGIARALATDPEILLMDEPFSALDPLVRKEMQFELLSIQKKLKKTVVFITHDINEAFKLGDRVGIMKDGKIVQIDNPEEMSTHPANSYVEDFIEGADKSQVLTVKNVMVKPRSLVKEKDSLKTALRQMRSNDVSSVYVVDNEMKFLGIILINDVVQAMQENKALKEIIISDLLTTSEETPISEIIPIASETRYPIAVLDEDQKLKGLVSKASILSSVH